MTDAWPANVASESLAKLHADFREPGEEYVQSRQVRGGGEGSYISHGDVTDIFCVVDPLWTWRPMASDVNGHPDWKGSLMTIEGNPVGLWGLVTVCGVTKPGFGAVAPGADDAIKKLISLMLVNASTRFGVGIGLKIKRAREGFEDD